MKKKVMCFAAAVVYAVIVIAASIMISENPKMDVVANYAVTSFETLGEVVEVVAYDGGSYVVYSPNRKEQFAFGGDVLLIFDNAPFIAAGLNLDMFEGSNFIAEGSYLVFTSESVAGIANAGGAIDSIEAIIRSNRRHMHYHMDHDLFELHLGDHTFRWAREIRDNTHGMTFVLNPEPFIAAGLNPDALEGWILADVALEHGRGETAPRLLRNFSFEAD